MKNKRGIPWSKWWIEKYLEDKTIPRFQEYSLEGNNFMGWLDHPVVVNEYLPSQIAWEKGWEILEFPHYSRNITSRYPFPYNGKWLICVNDGFTEFAAQDFARAGSVTAVNSNMWLLSYSKRKVKLDKRRDIFNFVAIKQEDLFLLEGRYDVIFLKMVLNRIAKLEHIVELIKKRLNKGGYLIVDDYIGPSRFQYTDKAMALVDKLLLYLPERLKKLRDGTLKECYLRYSPEVFARIAPNIAVRSDEIEKILTSNFKLVDKFPYGGTLLDPLLANIVHNFVTADDLMLLRMLCNFEKTLIDEGVIESNFAVFVLINE